MPNFISLRDLRDRVWPLAVKKDLATDMTGVSLPILNYPKDEAAHPYQVIFLIYYSTPKINEPNDITLPYASFSLDLQSGELVNVNIIRSNDTPKPLVGPGVSREIFDIADQDRRNLQELFFSRCDKAALIYAGESQSAGQADNMADLLRLYDALWEPPLAPDYETYGKPFFSWLREQAKK